MDNIEITVGTIRFSAMNLLAMREHSVLELTQKLQQKFNDKELSNNQELSSNKKFLDCHECITAVIEKLTAEGLQSDVRFAEAFVAMRQRQGKGSLIIRLELKERGIHHDIITTCINISDEIWNQIAIKVYVKKFGYSTIRDLKQLSKEMRFLTTRGFSSANIQYALKDIEQIRKVEFTVD